MFTNEGEVFHAISRVQTNSQSVLAHKPIFSRVLALEFCPSAPSISLFDRAFLRASIPVLVPSSDRS
jgi:hypothetical protein